MRSIRFIARKEFYHIMRDPRSLAIVILMPLMMTFLYGFAINLDIENIVVSVVDYDRTAASRELVSDFYNSTYFSRSDAVVDPKDFEGVLRKGESAAVFVIKPGFQRALVNGETFAVGAVVDGSDVTIAAAVQSYSNMVLRQFLQSRLPAHAQSGRIVIAEQVFYNPDLESSHFFVPGLVAIILMMISALLTSITIAREKETGTMEQLLTAPIRARDILIGKLLPYIVIAFVDGVIVLVFAKFVFGVPFQGSYLLLLGMGFIYVASALSIGILISSVVKTQQVAMMIALSATMLPSVMLSGFIFALKNMPVVLQAISHVVPARYFVTIIRGIMLKGSGLEVLIPQTAALVGLMLVFLVIAARKFNTRVV